jgi:hypothetical protein
LNQLGVCSSQSWPGWIQVMNIIKIQRKWEASRRSPAMTELQDGPGQLSVTMTQVIVSVNAQANLD